MEALTVKKNGLEVCTAGVGLNGTVTIFVRWSTHSGKAEYTVSVMGLDGEQQRFLNWDVPVVAAGDEIAVKIGQPAMATAPRRSGWGSFLQAFLAIIGQRA